MISSIAFALLGLSACLAALRHYRLWKANDVSAFAFFALALTITASAAFAQTIFGQFTSTDLTTFVRILQNLTDFVALPVIATAMIAVRFDWQFGRPAWGRWILALCAMFELLRRADAGDTYALLLPLACVAAMALASMGQTERRSGAAYMATTLAFAVSAFAPQINQMVFNGQLNGDLVASTSAASLALGIFALRTSHSAPLATSA
ncbi:MAG: hypothetical protein ACPGMR_11900 [Pontibacterium sp.]